MTYRITFDQRKRDHTLTERGIDFEAAKEVFEGVTIDSVDDRHDYGEARVVTVGHLGSRMVVIVWTERGDFRHIISMRKANDRERARYSGRLGRS